MQPIKIQGGEYSLYTLYLVLDISFTFKHVFLKYFFRVDDKFY